VQTTPTTTTVEQPSTKVPESNVISLTPEPTHTHTPTPQLSVPETEQPTLEPTETHSPPTSTSTPPEPSPTPEPTAEPTPTAEPPTKATPTPSVSQAKAKNNANLRGGPGTNYNIIGGVKAGEKYAIDGGYEIGGYNWFRLADGGWVRGDQFDEVTNRNQIPTVPESELPAKPTPKPATATPEAPPTASPELDSGQYTWSFVPNSERNKNLAVREFNLLTRGSMGTSPSDLGVVGQEANVNMITGQMEGGGAYLGSERFLIGKVVGPVVERSGFLYMEIECLDGSKHHVEIDMKLDAGIAVTTKDDGGAIGTNQTGIKTLVKGLFKDGDYVGFSKSTNPDSYAYGNIDHNSVLLFD